MKFSRSDFEMQSFESRRPVRLKRVKYEGRSKTARYREVSQIGPWSGAARLRQPACPLAERRLSWVLIIKQSGAKSE
jgi:hypothetical protein